MGRHRENDVESIRVARRVPPTCALALASRFEGQTHTKSHVNACPVEVDVVVANVCLVMKEKNAYVTHPPKTTNHKQTTIEEILDGIIH